MSVVEPPTATAEVDGFGNPVPGSTEGLGRPIRGPSALGSDRPAHPGISSFVRRTRNSGSIVLYLTVGMAKPPHHRMIRYR